jgi:hypothetical protein
MFSQEITGLVLVGFPSGNLATAADAGFRLLPISTIVGETYGNCGQAARRSELTQVNMNYLFFMDYQPPLKSRPMTLEAQEEELVFAQHL